MRILLLTQWFPPEPQKLLLELATTLREMGHDVTVLTGFPNYPTGKIYPGYRCKLWQEETIKGVRVIRVPLFPDHSRNAVRRAANFISFAMAAAILGPVLCPRVDVIHVIHPPLTIGLAAWTISRWHRVPFTYEIQDMWPETLKATGMIRQPWILKLVGWFARWVYSRATIIRVISPGFRINLIEKGISSSKIRVISNWVDTDFYRPVSVDPRLKEEFGFTDRFVVLYAGTIGPAQGIDCLVEAADRLQDIPSVLFAVFGEGIDRKQLTAQASIRGLHNIRFYGLRPAEEMSAILALADVLLIHLRDDPLFRITIPHKTFVYMAAGKPILAAVEGDVADVITAAQAGVTCAPAQPDALAESVRKLYALPPEKLAQMGQNGRGAAVSSFGRKHLVGNIESMLSEAVTRQAKRST
jgi:colanic acid biosynthesis glycosyl transferase WcaI